MGEIDEQISEAIERASEGGSRLNSLIAILVALAATCMALGNVKAANLGDKMSQAQAKSVDTWSYYQAKSTKQNLAESTLDQLKSLKEVSTSKDLAALDKRIAQQEEQVARYDKEKADIKKEAEGYQEVYDKLDERGDQFDLSEAAFSLAIALLGITALTQKRWLLAIASVFLMIGFFFNLSGFLNWGFHPDILMNWLG